MRVESDRFVGVFHRDRTGSDYWIAFLTWKLPFRGVYVVRAPNEAELRARLKKLDATASFSNRASGWC
jgi:hypothetical protein